jgi:hypothetical protein
MQTHRTKSVRYLFTFIFCGFSSLFSYGQSVGVRTATPQTLLDVNGSVAFREGTPLSIGNGNNHNSVLGDMSFYRITAPTANYAITGFSGGVDGRLLCIVNATNYDLTLKNLQNGSSSANQIQTGSNIDVVIAPSGVVTLIYNSGLSKWIVLAHSGLYLTQMPFGTPAAGATTDEILTTNGTGIRKLSNLSGMKGVAQYVIKSADESLTNSTTLQDDDALQFVAEANT